MGTKKKIDTASTLATEAKAASQKLASKPAPARRLALLEVTAVVRVAVKKVSEMVDALCEKVQAKARIIEDAFSDALRNCLSSTQLTKLGVKTKGGDLFEPLVFRIEVGKRFLWGVFYEVNSGYSSSNYACANSRLFETEGEAKAFAKAWADRVAWNSSKESSCPCYHLSESNIQEQARMLHAEALVNGDTDLEGMRDRLIAQFAKEAGLKE
jgi:hypothetical protein